MQDREIDLSRVDTTFGPAWSDPPLFYSHEFALRFQLGQGDFWMDRFDSARRRAQAILDTAFSGAKDLHLAVFRSLAGEDHSEREQRLLDEALETHGLPLSASFESRIIPPQEHEGFSAWEGLVAIEPCQISRAVWAAVSSDFGSMPAAPGRIFVLSLSQSLICHPYDDRGMDVISPSREALQGLFQVHAEWLLDYDRERMNRVFGP